MPIIWTLEQDLALRLVSLDLSDILADEEHASEVIRRASGTQASGMRGENGVKRALRTARVLRQELREADYLVDALVRLCHMSGVFVDRHLPVGPIEEQKELFNAWGRAGAPTLDLSSLYAQFPGAAHGFIQWAAGRGKGLLAHPGAVEWITARGLDVTTITKSEFSALDYAEALLQAIAASRIYVGAELN